MKDSEIKYLRRKACGKCDIEEIHNVYGYKKSQCEDGEMKYLRQKPCGKCDAKKFLEHVEDHEIKVRCDNF